MKGFERRRGHEGKPSEAEMAGIWTLFPAAGDFPRSGFGSVLADRNVRRQLRRNDLILGLDLRIRRTLFGYADDGLLCLPIIACLMLVLLLSRPAMAQKPPGPSAARCQTVAMLDWPQWPMSGMWSSPDDLLLLDAVNQRSFTYHFGPKQDVGSLVKIGESFGGFSPYRIQATPQGVFLGLGLGRFAAFDRSKSAPVKRNVLGEAIENGAQVGGIWDWAVAAGQIVAYADLRPKDETEAQRPVTWSSGFIRFPLAKSSTVEVFRSRQYLDPSRVFYLLGGAYPMLASLADGSAYAVVMDTPMAIYRFPPPGQEEMEPISAFPKELVGRPAPQLPAFVNRDDFPAVMKAVEESVMPTGLYGWRQSLYLVYRVPEKGDTRWMIAKISPPDRVVSTKRIPIHADHLSVIPGPKNWAFVAKGPVQEIGNQAVKQVLLIPSENFLGLMKAAFCP